MAIEKINNINHLYDAKKSASTRKSAYNSGGDNIHISDVAKEKAKEIKLQSDIKYYTNVAISQPEDTAKVERLKEIKAKLKSGYYDNLSSEVLDKVADNLIGVFFGK